MVEKKIKPPKKKTKKDSGSGGGETWGQRIGEQMLVTVRKILEAAARILEIPGGSLYFAAKRVSRWVTDTKEELEDEAKEAPGKFIRDKIKEYIAKKTGKRWEETLGSKVFYYLKNPTKAVTHSLRNVIGRGILRGQYLKRAGWKVGKDVVTGKKAQIARRLYKLHPYSWYERQKLRAKSRVTKRGLRKVWLKGRSKAKQVGRFVRDKVGREGAKKVGAGMRKALQEVAKALGKVLKKVGMAVGKAVGTVVSKTLAGIASAAGAGSLSGCGVGCLVLLFFLILVGAIVAFSAMLYEDLESVWPGPSQSKYLTAVKTVEKPEGKEVVEAGDILTYTITVHARGKDITNLEVTDVVEYFDSAGLQTNYYLERGFPGGTGSGYEVLSGYPWPNSDERVERGFQGQVSYIARKLVWETGELSAGDTFEVKYRVRVHDNYGSGETLVSVGPEKPPICNNVSATADQDEVGAVAVCVNAEGPETLAIAAENLVTCLVREDPNDETSAFNQYIDNCGVFDECNAAKRQFEASYNKHNHITCVNFVVAAMRCAGVPVLHAGHAHTWYLG